MSMNSIEYSLISGVMFFVLNEQNIIPLLNEEKCHSTSHNLVKIIFYSIFMLIYLKVNERNNYDILLLSVIIFFTISTIGSTKSKQLILNKNNKKCPSTLSALLYSLVFSGLIYIFIEKNNKLIN